MKHLSGGCGEPNRDGWYTYRLKEMRSCKGLDGRLIARFKRPGRQSCLRAENWVGAMTVSYIREGSVSIPEFPGFKGLHVRKRVLDLVVKQNSGPWKAELSSVAGVYLIADPKSGNFYEGSATGEGGIWQRWTDYANRGHGGNRDLKSLLREMAGSDIEELQFSVLEIADIRASVDEIRERESHSQQWNGSGYDPVRWTGHRQRGRHSQPHDTFTRGIGRFFRRHRQLYDDF